MWIRPARCRAGQLLLVAGSIFSLPAGGVGLPDTDLLLGTTDSLAKVRPDDSVGTLAPVELTAARNEFESFQVLLRSPTGLHDVDVEVGDLVGPEGVIAAEAVAVYLVGVLNLTRPSAVDGDTGEWPDPLLPKVDRYVGERRNAFPFALPANRTRSVWIEVYVPIDTPPGRYHSRVTIAVAGAPRATIPLRLEVWPFTLPSTSSLPTSFGLSGLSIIRAHLGAYTNDDDLRQLTGLYEKAALLHRVSTHGGTMMPPRGTRVGDRWLIYWDDYDREVGPFLDGTVLSDSDPLPGARATSVQVRTPSAVGPDAEIAYWRAWTEHFEEKGWLDRLFLYLWDEPQGPQARTPSASLNMAVARLLGEPVQDYVDMKNMARRARRADPRLVTAVTEQRVAAMAPVIDRWIPLINCLDAKPGYPSYCEETILRSAYPDSGDRTRPWFYQSCGSHGCDEVGGEYFTRWPSYMVDATPVSNRIMQWLAWRYRVGGELYHNMTRGFDAARDPWVSVFAHGGNGDGTFFYPGRPDVIGGYRHIPVESIRLKLLRDGLEDFEYLFMVAELGDRDLADSIAGRVAPSSHEWSPDPGVMRAARLELAQHLTRRHADRLER